MHLHAMRAPWWQARGKAQSPASDEAHGGMQLPAHLKSWGVLSTGLAKWPEITRSNGKRAVILSTHARAGPGT